MLTFTKPWVEPSSTTNRKELCFRLEDKHNHGIYVSGTVSMNYNETQHPSPRDDEGLSDIWETLQKTHEDQHYYFGFKSTEQLKSWFDDIQDLEEFQEDGVRIYIYQTDDYYISKHQMIFRKSTATLIGQADLI